MNGGRSLPSTTAAPPKREVAAAAVSDARSTLNRVAWSNTVGRAGFEPGQRFRASDLQSRVISDLALDSWVVAPDILVNSRNHPTTPTSDLIRTLRF